MKATQDPSSPRRVTGPERPPSGTRAPRRTAVGASLAAVALLAAACSGAGSATRTTKPSGSQAGNRARVSLAGESARQLTAAALASVTAGPTAQLDLSLSGSRLGSATPLVEGLHLVVDTSSTDGTTALSAAGSAVATEIRVDNGPTPLVDVIETGPTSIFVRIDLRAVLGLPAPFSAAQRSEVTSLGHLLDGHWFALPAAALKKAEAARTGAAAPSGSVSKAQASSIAHSLSQAVLGALTFTKGNPPAGGQIVEVSGTLKDLVDAALPAVGQALRAAGSSVTLPTASIDKSLSSTPVNLTGPLALTPSGTLTSLQLSASAGAVTAAVTMRVGHDPIEVTAPSGAVPLPQSLFSQIGGLGAGSALLGGSSTGARSSAPLVSAGTSGTSTT